MTNAKSKQTLYFPGETLDEIAAEAARLDRSVSWVLQRAWRLALPHMKELRPDESMYPALHAASGDKSR